jgi:Domain of unknown function (DUF4188)
VCYPWGMTDKPARVTADMSQYPDLVVIYFGMRVKSLQGLRTLYGFGPKVQASVNGRPDGLLLHEYLLFSLIPPHAGMRQYWRDFDSLERWARSLPHKDWWQNYLNDRGGTGFWHETYLRDGMESVFIDMPPYGLAKFAPVEPARGTMFSARRRLGQREESKLPPAVSEDVLYSTGL